MPEYSGIYLVENCVAERKRGKIIMDFNIHY